METPKLSVKDVAILVGLGVVAYVAWKTYEWFNSPQGRGTVSWWENLTGQLPSGAAIEDTTGQVGVNKEAAAFAAVVNNQSQGFYNAALQQYSYDNGMAGTFDAQGTDGWPWTSYDNWKSKNYPALPTASSVTVDDHGVYGNDYN